MTTSPAERMLNGTKTLLPTSQKLLQPKLNYSVYSVYSGTPGKGYYTAKAKDLPLLSTGQAVMIEPDHKGQLWRKATVVGQSKHRPRSYELTLGEY